MNGSSPTPPHSSVSKLDRRHIWKTEKERQVAESYEHKKAWYSLNYSILSGKGTYFNDLVPFLTDLTSGVAGVLDEVHPVAA
jgi:hypothetical protein